MALGAQLRRILGDLEGEEPERARRQLRLVNDLLRQVRSDRPRSAELLDPLVEPPRVLSGIRGPAEHAPPAPETGLAVPWLFTAGRGSPSLLTELRREAAACDQIDILVSFITVSGVRKLIDVLRSATAANALGEGRTRVRVLTTTYTGATEIEALDQLARLNGCELKISLDGRRTRLHAKAWIFHRKSGFGSAYVGSANLSGAALMGGLEWTVKFTERGQVALFERAAAHFDTLWLDGEFTTYLPTDAAMRSAVVEALRQESGQKEFAPTGFFDIQPRPFQQEMLDQLDHERAPRAAPAICSSPPRAPARRMSTGLSTCRFRRGSSRTSACCVVRHEHAGGTNGGVDRRGGAAHPCRRRRHRARRASPRLSAPGAQTARRSLGIPRRQVRARRNRRRGGGPRAARGARSRGARGRPRGVQHPRPGLVLPDRVPVRSHSGRPGLPRACGAALVFAGRDRGASSGAR